MKMISSWPKANSLFVSTTPTLMSKDKKKDGGTATTSTVAAAAATNQIGCATAHPRSYRPTSTVQSDSFSESYLRDSAIFGSPTGLADGSGC